MPTRKDYGVQHIVYISTNESKLCEHCHATGLGLEHFAQSVNHFTEKHGYRVFHIGTETSYDSEGKPWHSTVAVVGK
jgi:hypothetical protein